MLHALPKWTLTLISTQSWQWEQTLLVCIYHSLVVLPYTCFYFTRSVNANYAHIFLTKVHWNVSSSSLGIVNFHFRRSSLRVWHVTFEITFSQFVNFLFYLKNQLSYCWEFLIVLQERIEVQRESFDNDALVVREPFMRVWLGVIRVSSSALRVSSFNSHLSALNW